MPQLFPNGRKQGDELRLANIQGARPRKNGSCVITLKGPSAGEWYEFDGNQGGGPISAIEAATGLTGQELLLKAAEIAGVSPDDEPIRIAPPVAAPRRKNLTTDVQHIMTGVRPFAESPAAEYLAARGLNVPDNADLLYHPDLASRETNAGYAALIGPIRDESGDVVAVHRTYLRRDDDGVVRKDQHLTSINKAKTMLGPVGGGAVKLALLGNGDSLALSEGIETGLAFMTAVPGVPVWATLSTSGLEAVNLPGQVRNVLILADNDASGAGMRSAEAAAQRLRAQGRHVDIVLPPDEGTDFNDCLQTYGPEGIRDALRVREAPDKKSALTIGRHRPHNFDGPPSPRPPLIANEGNLELAVEAAWAVLRLSNSTNWLFRFGGVLTWVVPDDQGIAVARQLNEDELKLALSWIASWQRKTAKEELVSTNPPSNVVKAVMATPDPDLPVLRGIVNAPVFGAQGALLTTPGYHPDAELLYVPEAGFELPDVPEKPNAQQISDARALICDDVFGDFPFTGPPEKAHAVAMLLVGFVRSLISGPTPLHLIEKPTPGTGATLLMDVISLITNGVSASVMTEAKDDDEWRKKLTSKLREVPSAVFIDNINRKLDSAAVAAAVTAPFWEDRILGGSVMCRLPIRCMWVITGNNPEFSSEIARRIVRVRIDAGSEAPWRRSGFKHPELREWIGVNRPQLVAACLTLCRAWIATGRPAGKYTLGSFEGWSRVMGGILEVVGIEGFLENLDDVMNESDGDSGAWDAFIAAWWSRYGTARVGVAELYAIASQSESGLDLKGFTDRAQRTSLGIMLRRMRDRVESVGDVPVKIVKVGIVHKISQWQLAVQDSA